MAANCPDAGGCTCPCHHCRYGGHCQQHGDGCHYICTKPPKPRK